MSFRFFRWCVVWGLLIAVVGCVDPFSLTGFQSDPQLVIDGFISDQPGPYTVHLYHTSRPDTVVTGYLPEQGATVTIVDDQGNREQLLETEAGTYRTSPAGMHGVVGREYHLEVKTGQGHEYTSDPERLPPGGKIDSIYYEYGSVYVKNPDPAKLGDQKIDVFNIFLDAHGPSETPSYQRWSWEGVYKVHTFPELRYRPVYVNGCEDDVQDPVPCCGFIAILTGPISAILNQVGPCTCCVCWIHEYERSPVVLDDQLSKRGKFNRIPITTVRITEERFFEKYMVRITQMNLTERAGKFWKQVQNQKQGATSLFQPPYGKLTGNIQSVGDAPKAIGIFYAASVNRKDMSIYARQVPRDHVLNGMRSTDKIYYKSCLDYDHSTNVQPPYWQ